MELSKRREQILCTAVEEFIKGSAPITSGGIKDSTSLDCSTATLRSELNTLEALGYLRQLHTSGGRVPTPQGYRYYVEKLLCGVEATSEELEEVRRLLANKTSSLNELVGGIAQIISRATHYPTVVMYSSLDSLVLTEFKVIPLLEGKVMVLIGTNAGYINSPLDISADMQTCRDAADYLTKNFRGFSLGDMVENMKTYSLGLHDDIASFASLVDGLAKGLQKLVSSRALDIHREGTVKLLENAKTIDEAKNVLNMLDDNDKLRSALDIPSGSSDIEVDVAEEKEGSVASVIKAPIVVGGKQLASIGVIGPQRMDYSKIASALKLVIDELKNIKGEDL